MRRDLARLCVAKLLFIAPILGTDAVLVRSQNKCYTALATGKSTKMDFDRLVDRLVLRLTRTL